MQTTRCATLRGKLRFVVVCALVLLAGAARAATINVGPGQAYTTIQAGINAANNGDTVLVAPGTYYENIDFNGKAITVTSTGGAASTIIDGGGNRGIATVNFVSGELRQSVLSGFTVRNGGASTSITQAGGGIYVSRSAPSILNNIITANACNGIFAGGPALIHGNTISGTLADNFNPIYDYCSSQGAGVLAEGTITIGAFTHPEISGNIVEDNVYGLDAGGIVIAGTDGTVVSNNVIRNNGGMLDGAIHIYDGGSVSILQNLIYGNSTPGRTTGASGGQIGSSGGISISVLFSTAQGIIAANTFSGNTASGSSPGMIADNLNISAGTNNGPGNYILANNILVSSSTGNASVNCIDFSANPPATTVFDHNDIYNSSGPSYGGQCSSQTGSQGNLSVDPQFLSPVAGDFHLQPASPAIDAGDNSAPDMATADLDGNPRIQNGSGKGCIVDIGAYEYSGATNSCSTIETLTSSVNPSSYGQSITFTAQLSSANGVPTGDVQFLDGSTVLGTETISGAGVSTYTTSALALGSHGIVANYQPTGVFSATSATLTQVVNGLPTTTQLSCSPNPVSAFGTASFSAAAYAGGVSVSGGFTFTDNGAALYQVAGPVGVATYADNSPAVGTHQIVATFVPPGNYAASSASCTEVVNALATTTALTVTPAGSVYGTPVVLSAAVAPVTPVAGHVPTGTVSFYYALTLNPLIELLGTVAVNGAGVAALSLPTLPGGSGVLSCRYSGDANFAPSNCTQVTDTVAAAATTLALTSSLNPAPALTAVTFTAHLALAGGGVPPVGTALSLSLNGQAIVLATDASGSATYTTSALVAGTYPVAAGLGGTANLLASSASLTEVVTLLPTTTTLTAAPNPAYVGQAVTLTATITAATTATGGSVTFFDGVTALGTSPTIAQSTNGPTFAVLTTSTLALGAHPLTAVYMPLNAAATLVSGSTSPVVQEVVLPSGFGIALLPNSVTIVAGQSKTVGIQLTSLGAFAGPLALTVGTLPQYVTGSIAPTPVTLTAGGTGASVLTLNTMQRAEGVVPRGPGSRWPAVVAAGCLVLLPLGRRRRWLKGFVGMVCLGVLLQTVAACNTSYYQDELAAAGTYQVTVTATDANKNTQSAVLTVAITP